MLLLTAAEAVGCRRDVTAARLRPLTKRGRRLKKQVLVGRDKERNEMLWDRLGSSEGLCYLSSPGRRGIKKQGKATRRGNCKQQQKQAVERAAEVAVPAIPHMRLSAPRSKHIVNHRPRSCRSCLQVSSLFSQLPNPPLGRPPSPDATLHSQGVVCSSARPIRVPRPGCVVKSLAHGWSVGQGLASR